MTGAPEGGAWPYRFAISTGWLSHVWKSAVLQDHRMWVPAISRFLPEDGVAIDVGAHGGQFTRLLCGIAARGHVVAVEPSSYARSVLHLALWLRRVRNVTPVATALGDRPGIAMLRTPIKRHGDMGYGLANLAGPGVPGTGGAGGDGAGGDGAGGDGAGAGGAGAGGAGTVMVAEAVPVTTLDTLVAALGLVRVDFIKADIEGFEPALIAGAVETLRRHRPALLLEMDTSLLRRAGGSLEGFWAELMGLGYLPYGVPPGGGEPAPITGAARGGDVLWVPI